MGTVLRRKLSWPVNATRNLGWVMDYAHITAAFKPLWENSIIVT